MLDINFIRENPETIKEGVKKKGYDPKIVDRVLKVDETRRQLIAEIEKLRAERNKQSLLLRNKLTKADVSKGPAYRQAGKKIKETLRRLEPDLRAVEEKLKNLLYEIPNLPAGDVPFGKNENDNMEVKKWGKIPKFDFKPKDHQELGELLDIIDVKRAGKVSGTRFGYLKNEGVLLEFALANFVFETLLKEGFIPVIPPVIIKEEIMRGMGYLEGAARQERYILEKDGLVFVGTAEQSIGPMHTEEILEKAKLPLRYVGFSSCFRREAGSYGKDTRGIFRIHQFDKLEMFCFTTPRNSDKEHEFLLSLEEKLVQGLGFPYRVVKMCTGDLAFPSARTYDVEAWFPSQKAYREIQSCSTTTDFQARRLGIKYKEKDHLEFVHTLNATAFAIGRTILAILENYQQKDGSVLVPKVLQKYTGFKKISPKK